MRIELIKRPQQSTFYAILSPFLALALTLVAGAIMFSLLGKNPLDALYYYFIVPLSGLWNVNDVWQLHELAIKAAPLIVMTHCYYGYTAKGGPAGVGVAVGRAVRTAIVAINVIDFFLSLAIWGATTTVRIAG